MSSAVFAALLDISRALEKAGVPPLSPYWKNEAERFYLHSSARLLVECVGRGGDKSRTSTMMAVAETLAGDFRIPPGERHYFVHVAENRDEAAKTISIVARYLEILGVPFTRSADTIELEQLPRGIRVLACRVGAVSGFRCFGWTADENAKWDTEGADPSAEVIASIRAMTVTHTEARGRMISSPLGIVGHFFDTWQKGDTDSQVVGHAPSWEANPSITEAQTRALEVDDRKWAREYKAIPTSELDESLFSAAAIDRAARRDANEIPPESGQHFVAGLDPGFRGNGFTFVVSTAKLAPDGRTIRSVVLARELRGSKSAPLDADRAIVWLKEPYQRYRLPSIRTDQYSFDVLQVLARRHGIVLTREPSTATSNLERYEKLATYLNANELEIPNLPQLRADLLGVVRRITSNGFVIHLTRTSDGRHCDFAPATALALTGLFRLPKPVAPALTAAQRAQKEFDDHVERINKQQARAQRSGSSIWADSDPDLYGG